MKTRQVVEIDYDFNDDVCKKIITERVYWETLKKLKNTNVTGVTGYIVGPNKMVFNFKAEYFTSKEDLLKTVNEVLEEMKALFKIYDEVKVKRR